MPLGSLVYAVTGNWDHMIHGTTSSSIQPFFCGGRGSIFLLNSLYIYIYIHMIPPPTCFLLVSRQYRNSQTGLFFKGSCCILPVGWMLKDDCSPLYALPLGRMDFLHVLRSRWPTFFQLQLISERLSNSHRAQGLLGRKVDSVDPRVRFAADALM